MTQRIFDTLNEKDMADLWDILPEEIKTIYKDSNGFPVYFINSPEINGIVPFPVGLFKINWHDKTEITRPIQEATKADVGKICYFWNGKTLYIGKLCHIKDTDTDKYYEMSSPVVGSFRFTHCRRLTKQDIEELC